MKAIAIWLLWAALLGGVSLTTSAQAPACRGVIVDAPGTGMPVKNHPTWNSGDAGLYLASAYPVTVFEISFTPATGELWMRVSAGWVQSYSGYTTGHTQILLSDFACSQELPWGAYQEAP